MINKLILLVQNASDCTELLLSLDIGILKLVVLFLDLLLELYLLGVVLFLFGQISDLGTHFLDLLVKHAVFAGDLLDAGDFCVFFEVFDFILFEFEVTT